MNAMNRTLLITPILTLLLVPALFALIPAELLASQVNPVAANPQMRHFRHVFVAYGIAWLLLFGWVVAIFRRLGRVQERLGSDAP